MDERELQAVLRFPHPDLQELKAQVQARLADTVFVPCKKLGWCVMAQNARHFNTQLPDTLTLRLLLVPPESVPNAPKKLTPNLYLSGVPGVDTLWQLSAQAIAAQEYQIARRLHVLAMAFRDSRPSEQLVFGYELKPEGVEHWESLIRDNQAAEKGVMSPCG